MKLHTGIDLIENFNKLKNLSCQLEKTVQEYSRCFFKLRRLRINENIFHENTAEQEKIEIEKLINQLEIKIQIIYEEFLECTRNVSEKLKHCEILDFDIINILNQDHYEVMKHYQNVIVEFQGLQEDYGEENFTTIDFSKMECQKMNLNIAIKKCNEQLLGNSNVKLLDVYEIEKEVRQFFLRMYGGT